MAESPDLNHRHSCAPPHPAALNWQRHRRPGGYPGIDCFDKVSIPELVEEALQNAALTAGNGITIIRQFAEAPIDCVFTVEYSVRTAQMAVYGLFETEKKVMPVYDSIHKPEFLLKAVQSFTR